MSDGFHDRAQQPEREFVPSVLAPPPSSLGFGEGVSGDVHYRATTSRLRRRPYTFLLARAAITLLLIVMLAIALCRRVNNKGAVPGIRRRRLAGGEDGEDGADRRAKEWEWCEGVDEELKLEKELVRQETRTTQFLPPPPQATAGVTQEVTPRKRKYKTKKQHDIDEQPAKKAKMHDWLGITDDWAEFMHDVYEEHSAPLFGDQLLPFFVDEEESSTSDAGAMMEHPAFEPVQELHPGDMGHSYAEERSPVIPDRPIRVQQSDDIDIAHSSAEESTSPTQTNEWAAVPRSPLMPDEPTGEPQTDDDIDLLLTQESNDPRIQQVVATLSSLLKSEQSKGDPPVDDDVSHSSAKESISPSHSKELAAAQQGLVKPDPSTEKPQRDDDVGRLASGRCPQALPGP